jgi:hypothetical protein
VAGDVMTTATAGAEGAARIGESADSAQLNGQDPGETDQVTATGPQAGAPDDLQIPARSQETPQSSPGGAVPHAPREPGRTARPTRQTRQRLASAAQPVPEHSGGPV